MEKTSNLALNTPESDDKSFVKMTWTKEEGQHLQFFVCQVTCGIVAVGPEQSALDSIRIL
jgi:hypothetical protein